MNQELEKVLKDMENRIIAAVKQELDPKVRKEKERKQVFHNTKKLLRNYGKFVEHYNQTEFVASTLIDEDILEIINYRLDDDNIDDTYIKSLFKTKERTAVILNHINKALDFFDKSANEEHNAKKQRVAKVLRMTYVDGMKAEDIAMELHIDKSTVFKDINSGAIEISPLLFGIDGLAIK